MADRVQDSGGRGWSPWRIAGWSIPVLLLMLPAVAMQFTSEVDWSVADFSIAAVLFGSVGLTFELIVRTSDSLSYRFGAGLAVISAFLTIWVNGAVGMIGSENNPYNLVFGAVLLIALIGAVLARFRAAGMARAMTVAAIAQVAAGAVGMIGSEDNSYNLLFGGVLLIALIGAVLARFRAVGMARAMAAAAIAQVAAGAFGLTVDPRGAVLSMGFGGLWLLSAALFRSSAQEGPADRR